MSFFKRLEQFARNFIRKKSTLLCSLKKKKRIHISYGRNILLGTGNFLVSWVETPNHSVPSVRAT